MVDKNLSEIDLYGLLGIEINASENEIRKAYRKRALDCHPDKNPDNPKAAELFHQLSKALEILSDKSARTAYDRVLNAKKATELRNKQLDSKRQKLKADLEERERLASAKGNTKKSYSSETKTAEEVLKAEIDRLRKEGSRLLEEEQELLRKQLHKELHKKVNFWDSSQHRIKIKWTASKKDTTNGGYNEDVLRKYLQKYGDLVALVISKTKKGSALVEFRTQEASELAIAYEKGNIDNPLKLEWLTEAPKAKSYSSEGGSSTVKDLDFETLVLRQMRQAEERKRLIEEMLKEDETSEIS